MIQVFRPSQPIKVFRQRGVNVARPATAIKVVRGTRGPQGRDGADVTTDPGDLTLVF